MWEFLEAIVEGLAREYDTPRDVVELLDALRREGFLEVPSALRASGE